MELREDSPSYSPKEGHNGSSSDNKQSDNSVDSNEESKNNNNERKQNFKKLRKSQLSNSFKKWLYKKSIESDENNSLFSSNPTILSNEETSLQGIKEIMQEWKETSDNKNKTKSKRSDRIEKRKSKSLSLTSILNSEVLLDRKKTLKKMKPYTNIPKNYEEHSHWDDLKLEETIIFPPFSPHFKNHSLPHLHPAQGSPQQETSHQSSHQENIQDSPPPQRLALPNQDCQDDPQPENNIQNKETQKEEEKNRKEEKQKEKKEEHEEREEEVNCKGEEGKEEREEEVNCKGEEGKGEREEEEEEKKENRKKDKIDSVRRKSSPVTILKENGNPKKHSEEELKKLVKTEKYTELHILEENDRKKGISLNPLEFNQIRREGKTGPSSTRVSPRSNRASTLIVKRDTFKRMISSKDFPLRLKSKKMNNIVHSLKDIFEKSLKINISNASLPEIYGKVSSKPPEIPESILLTLYEKLKNPFKGIPLRLIEKIPRNKSISNLKHSKANLIKLVFDGILYISIYLIFLQLDLSFFLFINFLHILTFQKKKKKLILRNG